MAEEKLEVEIRANTNGFDRDMAAAAKSVKGLGDASDKAAKQTADQTQKMEDLKRASTEVGKTMMVAGAAIAAGIGLAVVEFAKYDKALSGYRAVSGATKAELNALTDQAMRLGETFGFTSVEVVDAATALNKAGVSTSDVLGGALQGALNLAATDTIEVADAAEVAAIAMTQFKLAGKDVPHIADLLAAGAANAVGDVKDLAWGLRQSGLVASQFGLSVEETVGTLAAFASAGLIGSDAGTSFKQMLLSLASPSGVAAERMSELGLSAYDAQGNFIGITALAGELQDKLGGLDQAGRNAALALIFGQDAIRSASVLYELGADGITDWINKTDQAGFAAQVAADKLNNLNGDWKKLTVSVQNGLIEMGSSADGFLRPLVQAATEAVQSFRELPDPVKGAILTVAGLTAGALLLAGAVMTAVPKIVEFKESWDKLTASGGKHVSRMEKAVTVISGLTAAYAAATLAIGAMGDAINATDRKASSTQILNDIAKAGEDRSVVSPALDEAFQGITNPGSTSMFSQVNDYESALKRIYKPNANDNLNDLTSDMFNKESGGGYKSRQAFSQLDKALTDLTNSGGTKAAAATFQTMQARAAAAGVSVADLIKLVPNYKDAMVALATQNGLTNISEEEKVRILAGTSDAMVNAAANTEAKAKQDEYAAQAAQKYSEYLAEIGVSAEGAIVGISAFTDFLVSAGLTTLSARDAAAQFEEALDEVGQKTADIMATQHEFGGVLNETATDFDLTTKAGRDANSVFADMAVKGLNAATAMAKNGDSQEAVQGQLTKTFDNLKLTAMGFGLSEEAADALTRSILHVPPGVDVKSWMSEQARIEAEKTKAAMDLIDGRVVRTYTAHEERTIKITEHQVRGDSGNGGDPSMTAFDPGTFAPGKAEGGGIYGSGPKGVDKDLYRLARGEHVWTAEEVDAVGGQEAMYAMRAAVRSGRAYRTPSATAAPTQNGSGQLPPIYIQSPVTGEYLLAQMDNRAGMAITRADQQSAYVRAGG